jgi:histidyl-tRNA synthetase
MFEPLKGFRDYYPKDWREINENLFLKAREVAKSFGFEEIEMPIIERTEFLTKKSGEEIKEQIFNILPRELLQKKEIKVEKLKNLIEMSLRFDLTMPAIRMAMKRYKELTKPIKWFYIAKNFRYEEPQKGRDREFFQIGVEFFGEKNFIADLEVLNFAITFLNKIGLKGLFKVKVNDRRLMDYLISQLIENKEEKQKLYRLIDKVRKISEEEFRKEAFDILKDESKVSKLYNLIKKPMGLNEAERFIKELLNKENLKEQLIQEIDFLKYLEKKANIEFDLSIVRGLDYYTGFVFEIYDKDEKYRSLAGGGRYDNLAEILGFKEKVYATGMALGPSVLEVLMKDKKIWKEKEEEKDFIIIPVSKNELLYAYEIAEKLREKGFKVEFAYKKGISKNLDYANRLNTKFAVIIGEEEVKNNIVTIKDLETGISKNLNVDLFIERIEIDKIDELLNKTLEERFKVVLKIKEIKEKNNIPIEDKEREKGFRNKTEYRIQQSGCCQRC